MHSFKGVDIMDQYISSVCWRHRTHRWTVKLFFHLFNIVLHNAFVLYKIDHIDYTKCFREFCKDVAFDLVDQYAQGSDVRFDVGVDHRHESLSAIPELCYYKRVTCSKCSARTRMSCTCGVKLCLDCW
jgi:hypothetical protein